MKKAILITALALISGVSFAQTKAKKDTTVKAKPQYEKFYKVSPELYEQFMAMSHLYRDGSIYNPMLTSDQKVASQRNVDQIMFAIKDLKIDSAVTKPKQ